MDKTIIGISVLDRLEVSTAEVVKYLESLDSFNDQIISVLKKKPVYPGYQKLPWYTAVCEDKLITQKLKKDKKLIESQRVRLKETLELALLGVKKLQRLRRGVTPGLQNYINSYLV